MPLARRAVLRAGLAAGAATAGLVGCGRRRAVPAAARGPAGSGGVESPGGAASAGPETSASSALGGAGAELAFTPGRVLRAGPPAAYAPTVTDALKRYLAPTADHPTHPAYAGAVVYAAVDGAVAVHGAVGDALRYGPGPAELPAPARVAMRPDAVFDLASITKVFTALLVLQQVERGRIALDAPVAKYLPEFGRNAVSVGMLLAHTGGLPDGISLSGKPTAAARRAAIVGTGLVAGAPGSVYRYSDVGLMVLGLALEKVTGRPLDALVRELATSLGLRDTGFSPLGWLAPDAAAARLVATDVKRDSGVVHDGNALALGGVAGHAGLFSTAAELAVVGQLLLNGGEYAGRRVLAEATVRRMLRNANPGLPAVNPDNRPGWSAAHGLGVKLDQRWFMGRLSSAVTFGHTGFTGTSLVVDPRRRLVLVVLTNRAHPDWRRADPDPVRVAVANVVADAVPAR